MIGVFVLIDALGWAYLKDRDFLSDVLTYRQEVWTVLGYSSGAIPVLLTGKLPQESGHWNIFYYDPQHSPFRWVRPFSFVPAFILNNRLVRRGVRFVSQRLTRFDGYFQIHGVPVELLPYFDVCEKKDIYRPGGIPGSIFNLLTESGVRFRTYSYHELSDRDIVQQARRDLRDRRYDFYFVYLSELDAYLHDYCKDKEGVNKQIDRYEAWVRQLYDDACEHDGEVEFVTLSDHGMTPKCGGFDLLGRIKALPLRVPRDYIALYDSTMARFWFFNDRGREHVTRLLGQLDCGHVLTSEEKQHHGLEFSDNRYGDIIFLMNAGWLIEPSFMGAKGPEGMHGFDPDVDPYASAAFLANRHPGRPVRTLRDVNAVLRDWLAEQTRAVHA